MCRVQVILAEGIIIELFAYRRNIDTYKANFYKAEELFSFRKGIIYS